MKTKQPTYYRATVFEGDRWLRYNCKLSFKKFVQTFWEHVPGAGTLIWNWHMDVICDELQKVAESVFAGKPKLYDLVINVPPGSSKSSCCSILFQAWTWVRMPTCRHICGSHSSDLALDLATKCRDVLRSDLYLQMFPEVEVEDHQDTKCLASDTEVLMADGTLKKICSLEEGDRVQSSNGLRVTEDEVVAVVNTGKQQVYEIVLQDGTKIKATGNHRLYGWDKWVKVSDLKVNDGLCVVGKTLDQHGEMSKDDAFLLALWLSEGTKGKGGAGYKVTNTTPAIISRLDEICLKRGWVSYKKKITYSISMGRQISPNSPNSFLRKYKLADSQGRSVVRTHTIRIPEEVMRANLEAVKEFICTYIACDGVVTWRFASIMSASKDMAHDFSILLRRLGIQSHIQCVPGVYKDKEGRKVVCQDSWHAMIRKKRSVLKLKGLLIYGKTEKLNTLVENKIKSKANGEDLPACWKEGKAYRNERGLRNGWVTLDKAYSLARWYGDRKMLEKLNGELEWRQIVSITPCGETETYDIQTKNYNAFFANGVLSHNSYYRISKGGDRYTCTVGGRSPLGMHGHILGIDDPIDPKEVMSEAKLQEAKDFFTNQLPGRKVNRDVSVTILIMQRLGVGDPTEVMLEISKRENASPVRHICLPAELTDDVSPPELKEKYTNGLLDEHRFPKHVLDRERATMGNHIYETQFLQRASIPGGSMFLDVWFNSRKKAAPYNCKRIRYWDRASSISSSAAYTAGVLMAKDEDGRVYVEDVVHVKLEPVDRNKKIRATALADRARYGPKYEPKIYVESEGGSSGRDAWLGLALTLRGFPIREDRVTGSKDVRAEPWAWALSSGVVTLIDNGEKDGQGTPRWDINNYVAEHAAFRPTPGGKLGRKKDMVDASSGAYNLLCGHKASQGLRTYNLGKSRNGPPVKIILATREQLAEAHILNPTVLISIQDPKPEGQGELFPDELPPHAIASLVGSTILYFADLDSYDKDTNESWDTPDPDTDKKPSELAINKDATKRMWAMLLRKYPVAPQIILVQGEDDGRHSSLGMAICDALGFKRDSALFSLEVDDIRHRGDPPNKYVYDVVKDARRGIAG